jgi:hypothetical protein
LAWTIAGPIYCQDKGYQYVPFNKADIQKQGVSNAPIHYIFALDDSGSMNGSNWSNLINSFTQTINRIKAKDSNNSARVSTIVFCDTARLEGENLIPALVNTNPHFTCGGT